MYFFFDVICYKLLEDNNIPEEVLASAYRKEFGKEFGDTTYANNIILNKKMAPQSSESIFSSVFYSMLLDFMKKNKESSVKKICSGNSPAFYMRYWTEYCQ